MLKASTALLSAVLALAAAAFPQDANPSPSALQTLSGQVMVVQGDSLVIATESGEERSFVMDTNVSVPPEASPGRRVVVTYRSSEGARAIATRVRVVEDDAPTLPSTELPGDKEEKNGPLRTAGPRL